MRCFVAIPLPDTVADRLEVLAAAAPAGRATPHENLHLTLAFLGDVPETALEELHVGLSAIREHAFEIAFDRVDLFGGAHPQILFAGIRSSGSLAELHRKVVHAARGAGLALRRERFRPHVTLARFNRPPSAAALERLGAFLGAQTLPPAPAFLADAYCLYRSDLGRGPARHTVMAEYALDPTGVP